MECLKMQIEILSVLGNQIYRFFIKFLLTLLNNSYKGLNQGYGFSQQLHWEPSANGSYMV